MSEPTLTDEQRETLHSLHATRINPTFDGCPICPDLRAVVAVLLADERAAREAAEAKVRDLTAGIGALAGRKRNEPCPTPCESCAHRGLPSCEFSKGRPIVRPRELRALMDDPAAALAEVRAEAWDEGYEAGRDDELFAQRGLSTDPDADEHPHPNPYRAEAEGATR